ncbi:unnamed protein product [Adineta steineri]|uniref:Uncharacterized protein n=1 Tax=Adineta steineri TaxID=433720 RepID=A0A815DXN1_9BILA|nr:unnamed protein product [Adineta steineri]CAF1303614.1 unnamed protein product [Adineta steineri]CAF3828854.1 unnamed protein product [Adineta steineri]CAF3833174.1 unnamed protein product [Adineta steineri]
MFPFSHINKSLTFPTFNIITTSSIYRLLNTNKRQKRREDIQNTITITPIVSNTTSFFTSTSTTQYQQISFDESYSVKTGIKTAALLGGMLLLVVFYLCWKARSRLYYCLRFSSSDTNNTHLQSAKFDLDYWLTQVDLLEAREAERNRENLSPYLELPVDEPRDNEIATATWIVDAWRQQRLTQYQQQHRLLQQRTSEVVESNPLVYRRRRHMFQRFIRRFLIPSHQRPSFLIEYSPSLIADIRPSIVNNSIIPPPEILDVEPRRVASWPRLKSTNHQNDTMMSALRTQNARKRLLKRASRTTTFDI